jgi:hypothetical protein
LLLLAAVYSLSYSGSWQIVAIAFVYDIVILYLSETKSKIRLPLTLWAAAGILVGAVINPYFPNNIYGGFIQNVMILKTCIFGLNGYKIVQGNELSPIVLINLLTAYSPLMLCNIAAIVWIVKKYDPSKNVNLIFFGVISAVYLIMTIIIVKFTDYYVPVAVIFIMLFFEKIHHKIPSIIKNIAIAFVILAMLCLSIMIIRLVVQSTKEAITYRDSCEWLNKNVKTNGNKLAPDKIIFTAGWDDTPYLFYGCPQFKYLVMLDPYFMYDFSKSKYKLWQKISDGETLNPAYLIKHEFGADIIFVSQFKPALQEQLDRNASVKLKFIGKYCEKIYFFE